MKDVNEIHGQDRPRRTSGQPRAVLPDPAQLAPSIERGWRDELILELRLLGVSGTRIGDVLLTVETHVRDSGEDAAQAFGDAKEYARAVAGAPDHQGLGARFVASMVLGLGGMLIVNRTVLAWLAGTAVELTVGDLAVALVLGALLAALLLAPSAVLRVFVDHRWVAFVLPAALIGGFVAVLLLLPQQLATLDPTVVGVLGVLALLCSSGLLLSDRGVEDPITAPGTVAAPPRATHRSVALLLPGFTVLLVGLSLLAHELG